MATKKRKRNAPKNAPVHPMKRAKNAATDVGTVTLGGLLLLKADLLLSSGPIGIAGFTMLALSFGILAYLGRKDG